MRLLAALSLLGLLAGCSATPEAEAPPVAAVATVDAALDAEPAAPKLEAHPAAAAFHTWVTPGTTIVLQADGVGPVVGGVADLAPYTVKSSSSERMVLVTDDGTEYTVELGESPRLSVSSLPDLTLTPHR